MLSIAPEDLNRILNDTPALKQAYLVGGCVRDSLIQQPVKDFDIEVFGLSYAQLEKALAPWGRTDLVGRSFGVVKLTTSAGHTYDFSIPRRDSKVAPGHKGFQIEFDPELTPKEAAARRDFTINSLMYDPRTGSLLDFFGGDCDLKNRVLRHTSAAFVEDPLRVLRGMQFSARFNLTAAPETIDLCRAIKDTYSELAVERVREEWFKWARKSTRPSAGLRFLESTGWIAHFPEIAALVGVPQEPDWHPEGDVFVHTCHCCDALVHIPEWQAADSESQIAWMLATLSHDFAKPQTTHRAERDGRIRIVSPGHEEAGGPVAEAFLNRIAAPNAIRERVVPLVMNHLAHLQTLNARGVRRLARRLVPETIAGLCVVMTADAFGRPPRPCVIPEGVVELRRLASELKLRDSAPKPILLGRHLIDNGYTPGPRFSEILGLAFEAQMEGGFWDLEGALQWLKSEIHPHD